ncbi:MAG: 16S rRNA (guanine(966)-N(2))-methyltransferase RsmD [Steroidobacter sp.]
MKSAAAKSHASSSANRLRIIGGRWRGTKLHFPDVAAIRPTPDRVRETLFNWLQGDINDSRCLDLFAGSGALGLEALSRGASAVTFVDREMVIGKYLRDTLQRLHCEQGAVVTTDALTFLHRQVSPVDIVFLDPPFADSNVLSQACALLESRGWLNTQAWIYIECPAQINLAADITDWPANWRVHRSKTAGQVGYHLVRRLTTSQSE